MSKEFYVRKTIRKLLLERMTNQAWSFFNNLDGFEQMSRGEVPSKEQLNRRRDIYYGIYTEGECQTIFQLETREIYDFINDGLVEVIWIHGIRSFPETLCQGKGMGTKVMTRIMEFADSIQIGVAGDVRPYGNIKMTEDDMRAFDARFGLMPLSYYKKYLAPELLEDEDVMWEIDDMIDSYPTWVWRPAKGSLQ